MINANMARYLDAQLRGAGLNIIGVSIGSNDDRSTWRVFPPELRAQAQPIIDAFVPPTLAQLADEDAARNIDMKALKALLLEIYPYLGAGKPTLAQLRANIIIRYRSLP